MRLPLIEGLEAYLQQGARPLHIPAHQGNRTLDPAGQGWLKDHLWELDLTEVPGLDDLHEATGIIGEAQQEAARVFGAMGSFFLVQGATVGIQAMVLAALKPGDTLVLPRYAHRSAVSAMVLAGVKPHYVIGTYHAEGGYPLAVEVDEVEAALEGGADGLLLVHTPYFGAACDLASMAALGRRKGVAVLVDEAHGAAFAFHEDLPITALEAGAHYTVQSAHKGLGSLGQSALLHAGKGSNLEAVRKALEILQTTSPSYPLMASLDWARGMMEKSGRERMAAALEMARWARKKINGCKGFRCPGEEILLESGVFSWDPTKLVIIPPRGMTGYETARLLWEGWKLQVELAGPSYVVALVTVGTRRESVEILVQALQALDKPHAMGTEEVPIMGEAPPLALSPREAYFAKKRRVPWEEGLGAVAGETITPYPPGIPLIAVGEIITPEVRELYGLYRRLGAKWQGLSDPTGETVQIIDD